MYSLHVHFLLDMLWCDPNAMLRVPQSNEKSRNLSLLGVLVGAVLNKNMTQCQLCKRQNGPIIHLSWTGLACKWVSPMDVITRGHLRIIFLSIRPFSATEQTTS